MSFKDIEAYQFTKGQLTSGQTMAGARMRGIVAGRALATHGTPIVCHGGKGLEVFSFLHGAAEGHCMAMAEQLERTLKGQAV